MKEYVRGYRDADVSAMSILSNMEAQMAVMSEALLLAKAEKADLQGMVLWFLDSGILRGPYGRDDLVMIERAHALVFGENHDNDH